MTRDVHTEHCCLIHGCKYGQDEVCTVVTGQAPPSLMDEECHSEIFEGGGWELAHLINDMVTKERDRAVEILCQIWMSTPGSTSSIYEVERGLTELLGSDWYQICRDRSHL